MQTSECAIFHLSTCDINVSNTTGDYANGYINSIGSINTFRTSMTWLNVDFNTILGDMLKSGKYENSILSYQLLCILRLPSLVLPLLIEH